MMILRLALSETLRGTFEVRRERADSLPRDALRRDSGMRRRQLASTNIRAFPFSKLASAVSCTAARPEKRSTRSIYWIEAILNQRPSAL